MAFGNLIQKGVFFSVILSFFFIFGCSQPGAWNDPIGWFLGEPYEPDVPSGLWDPPAGETEPGEIPYEADFIVIDSEGTYKKSSGLAGFAWKINTKDYDTPQVQKIACVEPKELPERFWEDYDSGNPIMDRSRVDKQWRNLYIPLDEYGIAQFSMKTRIPGTYDFELCGILDNDYSNKKDYSGNGSVTVDVPELGLVVIDTKCEDISLGAKSHYRKCQWIMEFSNGTAFNCWEGRPFSDMNTTDGQVKEGMFEILVEKEGIKEYFIVDAPMRLCNMGACGCGFGPYITVSVSEGSPATISIVKVNEDYYDYTGDGDPIVVTY